jgi:hypothetical protein
MNCHAILNHPIISMRSTNMSTHILKYNQINKK